MNNKTFITNNKEDVNNMNVIEKQIEFLKAIIDPEFDIEGIEIRYSKNKGKMNSVFLNNFDDLPQTLERIDDSNNIYFGVAARKDSTSGKKDNCSTLRTLWMDIDCGTVGHKQESLFETSDQALEHIHRIPFQPSVIVNSGHGLHLYWILDSKYDLDLTTIDESEAIMKQLGYLFAGDNTQNVDRMLRLPFTYNHKNNEPKQCRIIKKDYSKKYNIDDILSNPLMQIRFEEINIKKKDGFNLYRALFGIGLAELNFASRSEIDQKIITHLLTNNLTEEGIKLIFDTFPTTGKYFEHGSKDEYLNHSIKNAQEFLKLNENKKSGEIITLEGEPGINNDPEDYGYYMGFKKITNFTIEFTNSVSGYRDHQPFSYLQGDLILKDGTTINFKNFPAENLVEPKPFKKFIANLAPTETQFYGADKVILQLIKEFNEDIPKLIEQEFGFNEELTEYITPNLKITANGVVEVDTPIKNSESWGNNQLCLKILDGERITKLKNDILAKFLMWEKEEIILPTLAFIFLPIIYPFIKEISPNKSFMMLQGTSGSGKSVLAQLAQRFYGIFDSLMSWTSTTTSIEVVGTAFKDALFAVDDFKSTNFKNDTAIKNAMALIQNYSDNNSRQRANTSLSLRDEKVIKGFLLMSAEDVVFPESSTIARGIIVRMKSHDYQPQIINDLNNLSKDFPGITLSFIQYFLQHREAINLCEILESNRYWISEKVKNFDEISLDNLARTINNFADLKTSWDIIKEYLIEDKDLRSNLDGKFKKAIINIMIENLNRINQSKAEIEFENTMWSLVEAGKLYFEKISGEGEMFPQYTSGTKIGYYKVDENNDIKICINLKYAYREIKNYNKDISVKLETIEQKLVDQKKIKVLSGGKVSFGKKKRTGVEWTGDYPSHVFGVEEKNTPIEEAKEILNEESSSIM